MAKCVLMHDGHYKGRIIRLTDEYARQLVREGRAEFKSKEEWKAVREAEARVVIDGK